MSARVCINIRGSDLPEAHTTQHFHLSDTPLFHTYPFHKNSNILEKLHLVSKREGKSDILLFLDQTICHFLRFLIEVSFHWIPYPIQLNGRLFISSMTRRPRWHILEVPPVDSMHHDLKKISRIAYSKILWVVGPPMQCNVGVGHAKKEWV